MFGLALISNGGGFGLAKQNTETIAHTDSFLYLTIVDVSCIESQTAPDDACKPAAEGDRRSSEGRVDVGIIQ